MSMMGLIDPNLIQMLLQQGMMGQAPGGQPAFIPPGGLPPPVDGMMRPYVGMDAAMPGVVTSPGVPPPTFGPMPFPPGQDPGFGPMPFPPDQNPGFGPMPYQPPAGLFGPTKGTPLGPQTQPGPRPQMNPPMPPAPGGARPMPYVPGTSEARPMPYVPGTGTTKPMPLPMPQTQPPGSVIGGGLQHLQPPTQPGAPQGNMAMNPDQLAKLQAMLKKMIEEQNANRPGAPPPMANLTRGPLQAPQMQPSGGGAMSRALEQLQQMQTNPILANAQRRRYYGQ